MGSINFNVGFLGNERDTLGFKIKDVEIPVKVNENKYDVVEVTDLDAIKSNIYNILHWYKGDRILNPDFGNPLIEFIYEPVDPDTAKSIGVALKNSIEAWEPRVTIKNIVITPYPDQYEYDIKIYYDVPILNLYELNYNKIISVGE